MRDKHRLLVLLALVLGLALVFGCSDDDDDDPPTDPGGGDDGGIENVGSITGIVYRAGGLRLADATVTTGTRTTTTNEDGYFVLTAVAEGTRVVGFARDGYMSTFRVAEVLAGQATHFGEENQVVLATIETETVDGAAGGQVATDDGDGEVEFAADSFVDGAGNPYTDEVTVELNAMLPEDDDFYGTFPGEFAGVREDGTEVPFISYGFMNVQLLGADKAPLDLADGSTASLSLTISEEKAASAPATIPMWYFDEETGQWYEEGEATLDGNVYSADVAHFTTWNWDLPLDDVCAITGSVVDEAGLPVANARVMSRGTEMAIMDEAYTNAQGVFEVRAVRNNPTDVWAMSGSLVSDPVLVPVGDDCPVALDEPLVLDVPAYSISLTWGENPSDLDSHLLVPMTWDDGYDYYHIYFGNRGDLGDNPYAALDTDDVTSFGPEIITGTRIYEGRYQYWVYNWSFGGSEGANQSIRDSGATIQVEAGGGLWIWEAADLSLEGAPEGGWWHVFDMVVSGGAITIEPVNVFDEGYSGEGVFPGKKAETK